MEGMKYNLAKQKELNSVSSVLGVEDSHRRHLSFSRFLAEGMPIKWVFNWHPSAGITVNSQVINEICQCIEGFNGVKDGRWKSSLTIYKPVFRVDQPTMGGDYPRDFLGVSLWERPNKYYFILRAHKLVVEADQNIQLIMEKLQSYKARVSFIFEGIQYKLGDFMIRVAKVLPANSESLRGVVMEVEYLPLSSLDKSQLVMGEFFDILQEAFSRRSMPGQFSHMLPKFSDYNLSDQYGPEHTAIQYSGLLAHLISTTQAVHLGR